MRSGTIPCLAHGSLERTTARRGRAAKIRVTLPEVDYARAFRHGEDLREERDPAAELALDPLREA